MSNAIDWDGGQRINLQSGQTATCTTLSPGQLYCIFLYNDSGADHNIPVDVTWSNAHPPVRLMVPGTTGSQGRASLALVSGTDTTTVSIAVTQGTTPSSVDAWLGAVGQPSDTSGLRNEELPANGQPQPFDKYSRYYSVPATNWYHLTLYSPVRQFFSVQLQENFATVYVLNPGAQPNAQVTPVGSVTEGRDYTIVQASNPPQSHTQFIQGDGTVWVWMNADSAQNSDSSSITLQSLSAFALE